MQRCNWNRVVASLNSEFDIQHSFRSSFEQVLCLAMEADFAVNGLRIRFVWLLFAAVCCGVLAAAISPCDARQPNIVLVFVDDMGWGDFSCFGNTEAQTPAIDRMA
ncbi:MAG: sulfatase-like hydrolase/transferase, partial [Planctomycetales bacterium]|nr:sulfatase-like hydrolase/transferase [Planctomycetales bacterium]